MAETLFGAVGEIDFDNIINMENIIINDAGGYVCGSAFYLDQNITFNLIGTEYCSITNLVVLFFSKFNKVWKCSYFDWCRYRKHINFQMLFQKHIITSWNNFLLCKLRQRYFLQYKY